MTAAASSTSTAPPHARGGLLAPRGDCRVGQGEGLRSTCGRLLGLLAALGQKSRNEFGLLAARAGSSRRVRPLGEGGGGRGGKGFEAGPELSSGFGGCPALHGTGGMHASPARAKAAAAAAAFGSREAACRSAGATCAPRQHRAARRTPHADSYRMGRGVGRSGCGGP